MSRIFISYSRANKPAVESVKSDIQGLGVGHTVWIDEMLAGGSEWWEGILDQIRDCEVFVYALDSDSVVSVACRREHEWAKDIHRFVLPILVGGVAPAMLPVAVSNAHVIDYQNPDKGSLQKLSNALASAAAKLKPLPQPLPKKPDPPGSDIEDRKKLLDQTTLSYNEQSNFVYNLEEAVGDTITKNEARDLLLRLKKRKDLAVRVDQRIRDFLELPDPNRPKIGLVGAAALIAFLAVSAAAGFFFGQGTRPPVTPIAQTVEEAAVAIVDSVVVITTPFGSGFGLVVAQEADVVTIATAMHLVRDGAEMRAPIEVFFKDSLASVLATPLSVVGEAFDIAVIEVEAPDSFQHQPRILDTSELAAGAPLWVVGLDGGWTTQVVPGAFVALNGNGRLVISGLGMRQLSSGAAVVSGNGVVGIVIGHDDLGDGRDNTFAIPMETIANIFVDANLTWLLEERRPDE